MTRQASGFPCPLCGQDEVADIVSENVTHIVEMKCVKCEATWAVEL